MNRKNHRLHWLIKAPSGLLLTGLGLCLLTEAGMAKLSGNAWFWSGTLALVVFNAGLCLFGDAVRYRVLLDLDAKKQLPGYNDFS